VTERLNIHNDELLQLCNIGQVLEWRAPVGAAGDVGSLEGERVEEIEASSDTVAEGQRRDIAQLTSKLDRHGNQIILADGDQFNGVGELEKNKLMSNKMVFWHLVSPTL
jgi:hypothetical protein